MQIVPVAQICLGLPLSDQTNPSNYRSKEFDVICERSFTHIGLCQRRPASTVHEFWVQSECLVPDVQITFSENKLKSDRRAAEFMTVKVFNKQIEENTKWAIQRA